MEPPLLELYPNVLFHFPLYYFFERRFSKSKYRGGGKINDIGRIYFVRNLWKKSFSECKKEVGGKPGSVAQRYLLFFFFFWRLVIYSGFLCVAEDYSQGSIPKLFSSRIRSFLTAGGSQGLPFPKFFFPGRKK